MHAVAQTIIILLSVAWVSPFTPRIHSHAANRMVTYSGASTVGVGTDVSRIHKTDYVDQIGSLDALLHETKDTMKRIKELSTNLKDLELSDPNLSDLGEGKDADAMRNALAEAKAACDAFGPNSAEAKIAWEELDAAAEHHAKVQSHPSYRYSAAALKAHHSYNAVVDTQLLSDAISAFDTIEALSRFVQMEKQRLDEK